MITLFGRPASGAGARRAPFHRPQALSHTPRGGTGRAA